MQRLLTLSLVAIPVVARADVAPPPTGIVDFAYLGPIGGPIAAVVVYGAALWLYRRQRRTGRTRLRAIAWALLLIVPANLCSYFYWMSVRRPAERHRFIEELNREREQSSAPDAAHPVGVVR